MNTAWPFMTLGELLKPVSRAELVDPGAIYRILGAHWYAKGLYVKEVKRGSEIRARKLFRVEEGDFVYNRLFGWKGSFAIATRENHGCYVSNEFPCFSMSQDRLDPQYLRRYFSSSSVWQEALGLSTGGTPTSRNRLKEERLLGLRIPLPPLAEQRRIVVGIEELAGRIDEVCGLRHKTIEQTASFVSSVHLYLAGGRTVVLGDILFLDEQREPVMPGREYPQVGIKGFGGGLFLKPAVSGTDTTYKTFNRLYAGAVVLSQVKGWEGAVAVCSPELAGSYASPEYRTFRCGDGKVLPEYLAFVVVTPWFWTKLKILTRGVGARRERTRPERFLELTILMPTLENQKRGLSAFKGVDALKQLQAETAAELDALLPSILHRAFKGKL